MKKEHPDKIDRISDINIDECENGFMLRIRYTYTGKGGYQLSYNLFDFFCKDIAEVKEKIGEWVDKIQ